VFYQLEERIAQVWLLNAQHLKNVPGRKTDVADSAWIAQLVEHGLVRPSFVPPPQIRQLRDALCGNFRLDHHGVLVAQILAQIDFLDRQLADIDEHISALVADLEPIIERVQTIPGVARKCAIGMIAEIGVDMTVFPTAAHLASWAGICPGNNASGGKARSGHTRRGPIALKTVLTEAAQAAGRTKNTYLGARYHGIRGRRGTFKAVGAIRHDILIAYWHIVSGTSTDGTPVGYRDSARTGSPAVTVVSTRSRSSPSRWRNSVRQ